MKAKRKYRIKRAIAVRCPVCDRMLAINEMGVGSHLRKHVRDGELAQEDLIEMRKQLTKERFRFGEQSK